MKELIMSDDEIQVLGQDWKRYNNRFSQIKKCLLWVVILALLVMAVAFVLKL